jgi:hypothetical protein
MALWSGEAATISLGVNGQPLFYQWRKDSIDLVGETGNGLQISNIQLDQAGTYDAAVSNSLGTAVSSGCVVTVNPPVSPVIVNQPSGGSVAVSGQFGMSIIASGYPNPSYQWNFNGIEISGAINSTYFIQSALESQAGDYTAKAFNAVGEVMSDVAHVDVVIPT